jgi:hypothetical protein
MSPTHNQRRLRALQIARFLRAEGDGVLSVTDWNVAADIELILATASATDAMLDWLHQPRGGAS